MTDPRLASFIATCGQRIEASLERWLPAEQVPPARLHQAMRYAILGGGKRIRPTLAYATAEAIGLAPDQVSGIACAVELIHGYSLIHDDLPAMDDDDLRRGKPTNHTVFGEAAAILAGDGLLTFAFELLGGEATATIDAATRVRVIAAIARAAGPLGMVGGQSLDMLFEGQQVGYDVLRSIHRSKTGAMITAAVQCGGLVAGADPDQEAALCAYGDNIGLAFQIVDDLLDVVATTEELGKTAGSDERAQKVTYPSLFGVETSKTMAREAAAEAVAALASFDRKADPLRALANYIVDRRK